MAVEQVGPEWVTALIQEWAASPDNNLGPGWPEPAFAGPLVGFVAGDDPIYQEYKEVVGPYHWTPAEAFALAFPDRPAAPGELTVISWVLPLAPAVKADNRQARDLPAERWARARVFGEHANERLRQRVVEALAARGVDAVGPPTLPDWAMRDSDRFTYASNWSERHQAFAAGLGSFGLCDGLITARGKALRAGSVVARVQLPPTPRPAGDHRANCLFFSHDGACGKCIPRCPVGALSPAGHDKLKCKEYLRTTVARHVEENYGFAGYGCGLCQVKVPCESKIPLPRGAEG
ncbi:MAG: epoxyqueuosine reductase [Deltaproteobacteria bacterium]|nr:epoxyqueuosine reductase [Deltaproteobacteria bacterium]